MIFNFDWKLFFEKWTEFIIIMKMPHLMEDDE